MPQGAQRIDFLLKLTQNYIPVLLATGTAVVKNTFSTLDACCWKKKKKITFMATQIWQISKDLKPPQL